MIGGWEHASTSGYDEQASGFCAKLYANGSGPHRAPYRVAAPGRDRGAHTHPGELAVLVSRVIGGISALDVALAFAASVSPAGEPDSLLSGQLCLERTRAADAVSAESAPLVVTGEDLMAGQRGA